MWNWSNLYCRRYRADMIWSKDRQRCWQTDGWTDGRIDRGMDLLRETSIFPLNFVGSRYLLKQYSHMIMEFSFNTVIYYVCYNTHSIALYTKVNSFLRAKSLLCSIFTITFMQYLLYWTEPWFDSHHASHIKSHLVSALWNKHSPLGWLVIWLRLVSSPLAITSCNQYWKKKLTLQLHLTFSTISW